MSNSVYAPEPDEPEDNSELVMDEMIQELYGAQMLKIDDHLTVDFNQVLSEFLDQYQSRYVNYRK